VIYYNCSEGRGKGHLTTPKRDGRMTKNKPHLQVPKERKKCLTKAKIHDILITKKREGHPTNQKGF